jgi:hypothetical protein
MAYPGENENDEYRRYVIQQAENGEQALSKDEWRKQKKMKAKKGGGKEQAPSEPMSSVLKPGSKGIVRA